MLSQGLTCCAFVFSVALEGVEIPCVKIFEVIKESHSAELTVLMESKTRSSGPNTQTGLLLTAAGGAQKRSAVGQSAKRDTFSDFIYKDVS